MRLWLPGIQWVRTLCAARLRSGHTTVCRFLLDKKTRLLGRRELPWRAEGLSRLSVDQERLVWGRER